MSKIKVVIHLPRQCLRDGSKSLEFIGFLDGNVEFTPFYTFGRSDWKS